MWARLKMARQVEENADAAQFALLSPERGLCKGDLRMKVLITGAGGNLGRALVPALLEQGHTPRLMDLRALESPHETV